jgi:hypothetical protein
MMMTRSKALRLGIRLVVVILLAAFLWFTSFSAGAKFRSLFADLSIGAPEYQTIYGFDHPLDAVKGDYLGADFSQSDDQFHRFTAKVGTSETQALSAEGAWVTATSKINPKYPWHLLIKAEPVNTPVKSYRLHIEGRQPYN